VKILHLIDSGGLYGAEKMLLALVEEQVKQKIEPLIVSVSDKHEAKALEVEATGLGLPIKSWKMQSGFSISSTRRLIRWARENHYHLVHSHGYRFDISLLAFPAFIRKIPVVSTVHGYTAVKRFSKLWWYKLADITLLSLADHVAVVSEELRRKFFWLNKVTFIPNGLTEKYEVGNSFQPSFCGDNRYLASVGRLSREKGFDLVVRALAKLKHRGACPNLVIAGDGPERENLEEMVRNENLGDSIVFLGYVDDAASLIENADALIIPSRSEGLPIVLLEAMRAKTPVISTRVGEIPSVLEYGKLGMLCEKNADDLARAISKYISDKESAREIAESAYYTFCAKYTASIMAREYMLIYERVLNRC
jgi:glycosyltransferase involved in cell wall biosynthesis